MLSEVSCEASILLEKGPVAKLSKLSLLVYLSSSFILGVESILLIYIFILFYGVYNI